jgi:hypothetical protein
MIMLVWPAFSSSGMGAALAFGKCGEVNLNVTSVLGPLKGDPRSALGRRTLTSNNSPGGL